MQDAYVAGTAAHSLDHRKSSGPCHNLRWIVTPCHPCHSLSSLIIHRHFLLYHYAGGFIHGFRYTAKVLATMLMEVLAPCMLALHFNRAASCHTYSRIEQTCMHVLLVAIISLPSPPPFLFPLHHTLWALLTCLAVCARPTRTHPGHAPPSLCARSLTRRCTVPTTLLASTRSAVAVPVPMPCSPGANLGSPSRCLECWPT